MLSLPLLQCSAGPAVHWQGSPELHRDEYVEVRPARLGLARISVVRGEGPRQGTACIDDYVRSLEPVTDYLTKWSGLVCPFDRASSPSLHPSSVVWPRPT
jgi:hypothetical protein